MVANKLPSRFHEMEKMVSGWAATTWMHSANSTFHSMHCTEELKAQKISASSTDKKTPSSEEQCLDTLDLSDHYRHWLNDSHVYFKNSNNCNCMYGHASCSRTAPNKRRQVRSAKIHGLETDHVPIVEFCTQSLQRIQWDCTSIGKQQLLERKQGLNNYKSMFHATSERQITFFH